MALQPEDRNLALYCDFENIALGVRDAKYRKFNIQHVLERLLVKGSITVKKAYCDWDRYKEFKGPMHEAAFELIEIPHVRMSGKNSADIRMVVDALDLCYTKSHVDTFVIISGDSDFSPLVSKLRENAKTVIGVGVKNSTSDLLISNCDEFIYYDDLVRELERQRPPPRGGEGTSSRGRGGRKRSGRSGRGRGAGGEDGGQRGANGAARDEAPAAPAADASPAAAPADRERDGARDRAPEGDASRAAPAADAGSADNAGDARERTGRGSRGGRGRRPREESSDEAAADAGSAVEAVEPAPARRAIDTSADDYHDVGVGDDDDDEPFAFAADGTDDTDDEDGTLESDALDDEDDDGGDDDAGDDDDRRQEGIDLVYRTAAALSTERGGKDKLWGSMIKQTLKRQRPGFNETYYGFDSFSKMLEEAEAQGLVTLEADDRSGGYVIRDITG